MSQFSSIPSLTLLSNDLVRFEEKIKGLSDILGVNLQQYTTDHISLRCHDIALAELWRHGLNQCGECISDNLINGRPIYLFKLITPINVLGQHISIIELPFPTHKKYECQSWEHIEQVVPVAPEKLVEHVLAFLPRPLPEGISIKISEPKGDKERLPNPTVAITDGYVTLKYHPYSLQEIVESEC